MNHGTYSALCSLGLGGKIAELTEDLDSNTALQLRIRLDDGAQPRIQVLALVRELQHECLVVEACGDEVDLRHREVRRARRGSDVCRAPNGTGPTTRSNGLPA